VRQLPNAKVCFLGGAQALGGTKTPEGAPAKQKTAAPQGAALFAFAVLESEAAEKGSNKTTPLTEFYRAMKGRELKHRTAVK
jgi:hypothetical protein